MGRRIRRILVPSLGLEPLYNPSKEYKEQITGLLNWYSSNKDEKDAKSYVQKYLKKLKDKNADLSIASCTNTTGWIARIILLLDDKPIPVELLRDFERLYSQIQFKEPVPIKAIIEERIRDNSGRLLSEVNFHIDTFFENETSKFDAHEFLKQEGAKALEIEFIVDKIKTGIIYDLTNPDSCPQLKEAYSHLTDSRKVQILDSLTKILLDCYKLLDEYKSGTKPKKERKKREKSPEQLVKKLKYCEREESLDLTSIDPRTIIGSQELWIYHTKKETLGVYHCSNLHGLTVDKKKIANYDLEQSHNKKLRKPGEVLPKILESKKLAAHNCYDAIKAKQKLLNGKINTDIIILKVFSY